LLHEHRNLSTQQKSVSHSIGFVPLRLNPWESIGAEDSGTVISYALAAPKRTDDIRLQWVRSKPRDYGGLIQPIKVDLQTNNPCDPINIRQASLEKQIPQTPPRWRANPKGIKMSIG
jgi:hypothetical protein